LSAGSPQLILDIDADRVRYPRDYVAEAARRNLLSLRFPAEYGGRGQGCTDEIVTPEEVGVLGISLACLYSLTSIVSEAIHRFGAPAQKDRWLRPIVEG
jgi:alkylation response protein AidB-like acyl-CoA dehydrogenase